MISSEDMINNIEQLIPCSKYRTFIIYFKLKNNIFFLILSGMMQNTHNYLRY